MIEPLAVAVHAVKQMGDVKGMNIASSWCWSDWKSGCTGCERDGSSKGYDY